MLKKHIHFYQSCLLLVLLLLASQAWSATFNVSDVAGFQSALTTAQSNSENDTIIVADGIYDVSGGTLTFFSDDFEDYSITIEGSITGATIIDGGNAVRGLDVETVALNASVILRNLIIRNSSAGNGGGLHIATFGADIIIENCKFDSNIASFNGGGLYVFTNDGNISINRITARSNESGFNGGGIYIMSNGDIGDISITNSQFSNNTLNPGNSGGGLWLSSSNLATVVSVIGNSFTGNQAIAMNAIAGGVYVETMNDVNTIFTNNSVHGNTAQDGGGAYFYGNLMTIANNTISGNRALDDGGGIVFELQGGTNTLVNNIVWGNTSAAMGTDIRVRDGPGHALTYHHNIYSDMHISGGGTVTDEGNNSNVDPGFVNSSGPNPALWDVHLTANSPAIDAGANTAIPDGINFDRDGQTRIVDGNADNTATVDIGSDEYQPPPPVDENDDTPSTGGGGGGGCSLQQKSMFDPVLYFLLIIAGLYRFSRQSRWSQK
ncbi:MAG: JDVT-CTERM domain-containing protein [Gammaproteobacteria bacterium]|nr:JDVT-CTERM domain-containing protein [Gammaproteobacteria bacterium]MDH5777390.1 JDVT-CTERM domain-containing protein [Gammaproteobacteria bacterium]